MKRFLLGVCLSVTAWATMANPLTVWAQSTGEPAIVVAIGSINDQLDDVDYLTKAAGVPGGNAIRMQAEGYLRGVDKGRAIGMLFYFQESTPEPDFITYVPVKNYDDLLDTVARFASVDDQDGYSVIDTQMGQSLYVKEVGSYAVVALKKELLDNAPNEVSDWVGELGKQYNLGARLYAQRIPAELREQALTTIEETYRAQLDQMGDDEFGAELQAKNFELQMAQMRSLINDTDELVVGMNIDRDGQNFVFEMNMTGLDGSTIAEQSAAAKNAKPSKFRGFQSEGATFTALMNYALSEKDRTQYESMLGELKNTMKESMEDEEEIPAAQQAIVNELFDDFFAVIENTLKDGTVDAGMSAVLDEENANLAMGMLVASPKKLEDRIKDIAEELQKELGEEVTVNLDCEKANGVNFHEIVVAVPESEEEVQNLVGEEVKIYIGFGSDVVYLGVGNDPATLIKSAMAKSSQSSAGTASDPMMEYNLFLAPLFTKIGQAQEDPMMNQIAEQLKTSGRDRIQFLMKPVDNGFNFRMEAQDGFLSLIGVLAPMMGGMGGADF